MPGSLCSVDALPKALGYVVGQGLVLHAMNLHGAC